MQTPIVDSSTIVKSDREPRYVGSQNMARVTTRNGYSLTCTTETLFGIVKTADGNPLTIGGNPSAVAFRQTRAQISVPNFMRGLLFAGGMYTSTESRPGQVDIDLHSSGDFADRLEKFIYARIVQGDLRDKNNQPWKVITKVQEDLKVITVKSRVFDFWAEGYIEPTAMVIPTEHWNLFSQGEFLAGAMAGMRAVQGGARFVHKNATMVAKLHHHLLYDYGVRSRLNVNPMEPETQIHTKRIKNPHELIVPLDQSEEDQIIRIEVVGQRPAMIVESAHMERVSVGPFIMDSEFETSEDSISLATLPFLLS